VRLIGPRHTAPITPSATTLLERSSPQLCESRTHTHYLCNLSRVHRGYSRYLLKKNTVHEPHFFDDLTPISAKRASVRRVPNALSILATSGSALETEKLWRDQATSGQR
jgi:hypothetical protein